MRYFYESDRNLLFTGHSAMCIFDDLQYLCLCKNNVSHYFFGQLGKSKRGLIRLLK